MWSPETAQKALTGFRALVETLGSVEAAQEAVSALAQVPVGYLATFYGQCDPTIGYHAIPHWDCILRGGAS